MKTPDSAELAAIINTAASLLAKGKTREEIEMLAIAFDLLSDTLFAIALIEKKQRQICEEFQKNSDNCD
jgi:hypothetical protein